MRRRAARTPTRRDGGRGRRGNRRPRTRSAGGARSHRQPAGHRSPPASGARPALARGEDEPRRRHAGWPFPRDPGLGEILLIHEATTIAVMSVPSNSRRTSARPALSWRRRGSAVRPSPSPVDRGAACAWIPVRPRIARRRGSDRRESRPRRGPGQRRSRRGAGAPRGRRRTPRLPALGGGPHRLPDAPGGTDMTDPLAGWEIGRPLPRDARVFVAGSSGLVGSAVARHLRAAGFTDVVGVRSAQVDLRDADATAGFLDETRPAVVVDAAARVGGIAANDARPVEFLHDNLRIQANLLDAAHARRTPRGCCSWARRASTRSSPSSRSGEDSLLTGPLEATNDAYAIAKIAGIMGVQSYRREYGRRVDLGDADEPVRAGRQLRPGVLARAAGAHAQVPRGARVRGADGHGVGDGDAAAGVPARRRPRGRVRAPARGTTTTRRRSTWATGRGRDDRGARVGSSPRRWVSPGRSCTTRPGPDGTPRKVLDVSRIEATGWKPRIGLDEGLASTYRWYLDNSAAEATG